MATILHRIKAFLYENLLTTAVRTHVDASDIVINNPSELMVIIPDLESGLYKLEVTTQFSAGKTLLQEPRSVIFDKILTVS
ncbi:hypothetical protein EZS27_003676 [termite gut metagenome]|uniref:DUF4469 domain-containing protein n=1 Tax=termite gut metagenome TaxID=433724 RepID=A0A5J4SRX1_9ZZZZ